MCNPHKLLRDRSDSLKTPNSISCLPTKIIYIFKILDLIVIQNKIDETLTLES
jgi:hypothetical protein